MNDFTHPRPVFDGLDGLRSEFHDQLLAKFVEMAGIRPTSVLLAAWSRELMACPTDESLEACFGVLLENVQVAVRSVG